MGEMVRQAHHDTRCSTQAVNPRLMRYLSAKEFSCIPMGVSSLLSMAGL
jgi:hypothetical protein